MKIAISLPREEFLFLEKLKNSLNITRSKLIQQAIAYWLQSRKEKELIYKYEKGYRQKPERISKLIGIEKAQYNTLSEEAWQ